MIVVAGVTCAAGFGALAVLMLGLHTQIRRLTRMAEAVQASLQANLKEMVSQAAAPAQLPPVPAPSSAAPPRAYEAATAAATPSVMQLAAATAASIATSASTNPPGAHDTDSDDEPPRDLASRWTPDRRLLVMRLAARGNRADQIAAALRIPLEEIELFLKINKLVKNEAFQDAVKTEILPAV